MLQRESVESMENERGNWLNKGVSVDYAPLTAD